MNRRRTQLLGLLFACVALIFTLANRYQSDGVAIDTTADDVKGATVSSQTSPTGTQQTASVSRVIDGDTIELAGGAKVRYIGIDTPEIGSRNPECFGMEAKEYNRQLVEGKEVILVKDVSETDRYGRLLRYVFVGDTFVNLDLVTSGHAYASSYPPDVAEQEALNAAQRDARSRGAGLWTGCGTQTESLETTTSAMFTCDCSKSCQQIASCAEAQYLIDACGCTGRDGDGDGVACENAPLYCR